jgi:proline iminopeptidase
MRLTVNGTELYLDVEGAGLVPDGPVMRERPTVLLLHGGPGFDHAYFKPALSALADTAQLVYLDQRGQGRSGRPPVETCTLEQMADDAAAVCRALGLDHPAILGHSAGGFVALHLAVRHSDVIGRLILVDTAAASTEVGDMAVLERRGGAEAVAVARRLFGGDFSEETGTDFNRLVLPTYVHDPAAAGPILEALARSSFNPEVASYYFGHRAAEYDLCPRLGEIRTPTLVLVGESDWVTRPSASQTIAAGIPGAELVTLPGAGHFAFGEQPELFTGAVRRFLTAPMPIGAGGI